MLDALKDYLAPREERLTFAGVDLVVRELGSAADTTGLSGPDARFLLLVGCVFRADDGQPAFGPGDVEGLRVASPVKLAPLMEAVVRVNGLDAEAEAKNSGAGPSAG